MPAFNAEAFICESISSVQKQTFTDWELIVVDDGSSDGTSSIVETFLSDARIRLIRQRNGGVSTARNAALAKAKGDWIAFLDADDVWYPEKLQEQLAIVERHPDVNLVFTNYYLWDGQRDLELRFKSADKFPVGTLDRTLIFYNLFGMSSVLVSREAINTAGEFDPAVAPAEDWDMWLRIADNQLVAAGIDKPLLRYRVWSGNASKNTIRMTQSNVRVLEKAVQRSKRCQSEYGNALRIARGNYELATGTALIDKEPSSVALHIYRAWQHYPTRLKWLFWYLGVLWPGVLGGSLFRERIYRKLKSKW